MTDEILLNRHLALIKALHKRTREGKLNWQETNRLKWFMVESSDLLLEIGEIFDPDYPEQPDYALVITDPQSKKEIERISNTTLRPVSDRTTEEGLSPYTVLQQIHGMARRKALHVDDALDSLIETLGTD